MKKIVASMGLLLVAAGLLIAGCASPSAGMTEGEGQTGAELDGVDAKGDGLEASSVFEPAADSALAPPSDCATFDANGEPTFIDCPDNEERDAVSRGESRLPSVYVSTGDRCGFCGGSSVYCPPPPFGSGSTWKEGTVFCAPFVGCYCAATNTNRCC
jgi:hypothetical protein